MLLCIYIFFVEVIVMDVVQSECVPDNSLRVEDEEMRLHGQGYLRCQISNVCQDSQSSIFYKCDTKGANCQKMFEFIMTNDSVSFFGGTNRSIWTQYYENNFFDIVLRNPQAVDDGIWKIYIRSLGSNYECVNINVITYVRPKEISIIPLNIPTSRKFNLTCLVNKIRPVYPLFLVINGFEFRTGVQIDTPNGDTWNISYSVELMLSPNVPLTARCIIGYEDDWSLYDYWVYSDNLVIDPIEDAPILESTIASTYDVFTPPDANVMVVCQLCSYPTVEEYKWFKGNIQLGNDRTLMIPYVTESDFGKYTCIATNLVGSTNFTVDVIKLADSKTEIYQANVNEEVKLDCPLCVDIAKECSWEIDDQHIHIGRVFTIVSLNETDYGNYLCTVVFEIGRTWMRIGLVKPETTTIGSTTDAVTATGEIERSTVDDYSIGGNYRTEVDMPASEYQEERVFTAGVIAGFAVIGAVVVGMIVPITVLSCILARRQQSRDKVTDVLSTNPTTSEETANHYEQIQVAYGNNPVYENAPPRQAPNHI